MVCLKVSGDVHSAQSLIQGHLTEMPSEMAVTPVKTANKPDDTSETDKTDEPKDWGGAHPKTRQQSKAMVRGHMCLLNLFSLSISETILATGVYI